MVNDEYAIDKCVEGLPALSKRPQRHLVPSFDHVPTRGLLYLLVFRMKYARRTGCRGSDKSLGTPL